MCVRETLTARARANSLAFRTGCGVFLAAAVDVYSSRRVPNTSVFGSRSTRHFIDLINGKRQKNLQANSHIPGTTEIKKKG